MIGIEQLSVSSQAAIIVVPVAVYFFLLGLLNSQPRPQVLSGRIDFILLNAAFFPLFCVPVLSHFAASGWWTAPAVAAGLVAAGVAIAPRRWSSWVIYNISVPEALRALERALQAMGEPYRREDRRIVLLRRDARLRLGAMPLLRNVSILLEGKDRARVGRGLEGPLGQALPAAGARPSPAAVACLLVAAAMLVVPLGLFADRMPEMVRLITDLVK